jgi:putative membrane protein
VSQGDIDPRYSLANERTFLAWIRTSLGLLVAAAALVAVELPWPADAVRALAVALAAAAGGSAFASWARWRAVEHAISTGQAAPPPRAHIFLAGSVGLVSVVVIALILM